MTTDFAYDPRKEHLVEIAGTVAELRSVGAELLAEGVETAEQAAALTEAGASLAQGWHFGCPVACAKTAR